jgi:hypothetical protein
LALFWRLIWDHLECPDIAAEYTDYHEDSGDGGSTDDAPRASG